METRFARAEDRQVPLYEAKLLHQFDHRWATYDGEVTRDMTLAEKQNPAAFVIPRYWVQRSEVTQSLPPEWSRRWLLGLRDICRNTDFALPAIPCVFPLVGSGHKFLLLFSNEPTPNVVALYASCLPILP